MSYQKQIMQAGITAYLIHVKGRVQGVGFRPFVYRLAHRLKLAGYVYNQPDGVMIHIEGFDFQCMKFFELLKTNAPLGAVIKRINKEKAGIEKPDSFKILPSKTNISAITEICPDIAICPDCLEELYGNNRRNHYPFINCTNCGPRFTLIDDFPYDRHNTTMHEFDMCNNCESEYFNPMNRRFHAQPTSCPSCGPVYTFLYNDIELNDFSLIIRQIGNQINQGKVLALKGLGGYNLVCDARNPDAVAELRLFKHREKKPFAVMFRSLEHLKKYTRITDIEEEVLISWRRPIVILEGIAEKTLPKGITTGLNSVGAFLPYLPLHHLLFDEVETDAIVVTSGNESDIPILYTEVMAKQAFQNISGGILMNNRKIARRADDSVVKVIDNAICIMRRARGYAPDPVDLNFNVDGIFATGAELSNCFCIGKEKQGIFSQHIGDLKNADTYNFFAENIQEFSRMYRFKPQHVVCDMHPDYLSTQYARELRLPFTTVQHHHAHIASVMAEYGINDQVLGISYDGTGYGTDGNIWGSELLLADFKSFERLSHFEYIPLPGGDMATMEPWRSGLAYLYHVYGNDLQILTIPFIRSIDLSKAKKIISAIDKGINSPLCCSAGRLFDAVSAILTLCIESNYHAEAPMRLENKLESKITASYSFSLGTIISFSQTIREIVDDILSGVSTTEMATKFHNTIATAAARQIQIASEQTGVRKVVITGGTFQNRYLTEKLLHLLRQMNLESYYPREIPFNDGGIALGQLAVAAHKM